MRDEATVTSTRTLSVLNFILGIWLIISPYVLGYATMQARWEQMIGGLIVAILSAVQYYVPEARWASWINSLAALWLIVAPFVSGYETTVAYWNEVIAAIAIGAIALWNAGVNDAEYYNRRGHAV